MRAELISVGTELLMGQIVDTNAAHLAGQLPGLGIDCYHISAIGDNQGRIVELLRLAWSRSDLIIMTGGLGPTGDDLTRESIAELLGETMVVDPVLETELRSFFAGRGVAMPDSNVKQATRLPSVTILPNPVGTAPGWWAEKDGHILVAMPGVPHEMRRMWANEVVPRLRERQEDLIVSRTFKVIGKGESAVEDMVRGLMDSPNPTLAPYAKNDGIHLRITAKAPTLAEADRMIDELEREVRAILTTFIYGIDDDTLPGVIGNLLQERGQTLATMESCTGGLLANAITDEVGSSAYFLGGSVAYSRELKAANGVPEAILAEYGTVSAETALAMAEAARRTTGADYALSTTGVAGPEPVEGHPAGTVFIGIAGPNGSRANKYNLRQARPEFKRLTALTALNLLRRELIGAE